MCQVTSRRAAGDGRRESRMRRAERMIDMLHRLGRLEAGLPAETSALTNTERAQHLIRFVNGAPTSAALRDAVAMLAARRKVSWNTGSSVWRGMIALYFPEVAGDRRRLSELARHWRRPPPTTPSRPLRSSRAAVARPRSESVRHRLCRSQCGLPLAEAVTPRVSGSTCEASRATWSAQACSAAFRSDRCW